MEIEIKETTWAYFAGMLDGEGYFALIRHYKKSGKVSTRGYEIEPRIALSNMNLSNLEGLQKLLNNIGKIQVLNHKTDNLVPKRGYELRFCAREQRIILPKIIPFLMQKRSRACLLLALLSFREKGSLNERKNQIIKPLIEQYYLDLERQFEQAIKQEKPWLDAYTKQKSRKKIHIVT